MLFKFTEGFLLFWPPLETVGALEHCENGKLCSVSFDINLFKAAILSVNFCTSFFNYGGLMRTFALILAGLALIPFTDTRHPRTFPLYPPNTRFSRLSLNWAPRMFAKVSVRSSI
jgi:hypothetical protein